MRGGASEDDRFLRESAIKNVVDESGLPSRNAGDDREQAKRQRNVHVFRLVRARAKNLYGFSMDCGAFRNRNSAAPLRYCP